MARDLISLIQASGGSGGSGESFRDDVTGAGDGVDMASYILNSAGWTPAFASSYPSGTVHEHVLTIAEESRSPLIRASGGAAISLVDVTGDCAITDQNVSSSEDGGGTADVTLTGELEEATPGVTPVDADGDTSGEDPITVTFSCTPATGGGPTQDAAGYTIRYADPGDPFNTGPIDRTHSFHIQRRLHVYEFRWCNTNDFDDPATDLSYTAEDPTWMQDHVGQDRSLWLFWRVNGGSWNGGVQAEFIDPREEV